MTTYVSWHCKKCHKFYDNIDMKCHENLNKGIKMKIFELILKLGCALTFAYAGYYKSDWIFSVCLIMSAMYFINVGLNISEYSKK